jgi:hypothetical protein
MKKHIVLIIVFVVFVLCKGYSQTITKADSLGLPGDNLNLFAVLDLFQQSETFEIFEKKLNEEDSKINNLDLNNDSKTDYIKVIDHAQGESHSIVLQVPINEKENQDVAVIEIEKDKNGKVVVQIIGNEDLYGKDYIVEPLENDLSTKKELSNNSNTYPNKKSDTTISKDGKTVIINNTTNNYYNGTQKVNEYPNAVARDRVYIAVDYWPIVHYMYAPSYIVYVSPWYWYSYPLWWHPWTPWFWHDYYWHHYNYHHDHYYGHYHHTNSYRNQNANSYYGARRSSSSLVQNNRSKGIYSGTYNAPNRSNNNRPAGSNPGYKVNPSNNDRKENNYPASKDKNKPGNRNDNYNNPRKPNYDRPANRPRNNSAPRTSPPRQNNNQPHRSGGGGRR